MADKYDTTIKLGLDADISGGVQTEKQLEKVRVQAKRLEQDTKNSGASIEQSFGKATKAAGLFRRALTGFGVVTGIMGLVGAIGKIRESFGKAKAEAEELARAKEKAERRDEIEKLAKSYEDLGRAIGKSAEALRRSNELQDIATKNARDLEDAQLDLAEQQELATVDMSNPAAKEIRAAISAKYAAQRGARASTRSRENVATEYNRLNAEAGSKRSAANKIMGSLAADDSLIEKTMQMIQEAERKSIQRNAKDVPAESMWYDFKKLYTLNWGALGSQTTEEGDAVRKQAAEQAKSLKEELKALKENRENKKRQADDLIGEAEHLENRAGAVYGALSAVDVRETTSAVANEQKVTSAEDALSKKNAAIAMDQKTIAAGPGRIAALKDQIASVEAQALAAKQADAKEQMDAQLAQSALDAFNSAGHRRNGTGVQATRSKLEADVERETNEAAQSRAQLQSTLAALSATLKGLNADLKKVQREVDAATKRQSAVNDGAPEG